MPPGPSLHADHVPERDHLGMAGQGEVGLDGDPARPVDLGAACLDRARPPDSEAVTPAAQITVRAGDALGRARRAPAE